MCSDILRYQHLVLSLASACGLGGALRSPRLRPLPSARASQPERPPDQQPHRRGRRCPGALAPVSGGTGVGTWPEINVWDVLRKPRITEKGTMLAEHEQVRLRGPSGANKHAGQGGRRGGPGRRSR